jgi:hypothetical protein
MELTRKNALVSHPADAQLPHGATAPSSKIED